MVLNKTDNITKKQEPVNSLSFYLNHIDTIRTYKLYTLKNIARHFHLHVSGTKPFLIQRICDFLHKSIHAIKIQKLFRGYIIRCFLLKGPAFKKRELCINETDFYTLEPLNEIEFTCFYSFQDSMKFIYGFNIFSIIKFFLKKHSFINPYNRENLSIDVINHIFSLFYKTFLLFPSLRSEYVFNYNECLELRSYYYKSVKRIMRQTRLQQQEQDQQQDPHQHQEQEQQETVIAIEQTQEQTIRIQLAQLREMPIATRIRELFIEFDILGNYTDSSWFHLSRQDYIYFLRYLHRYWNYIGNIPPDIKQKICIIGDIFQDISISNISNLSTDECREQCVYVMENMTYCGETDEFKKLGTLYILSCLTVVSLPCRSSMVWLYEALPY
jgi:hypothetical protein